ncbi:hypothetical protein C8J57DRAFT_1247700 [Mycena rebaudengoi]|nr:hypothetical protein C8J57DRAFT_1247700 [Mycena rebaudengoi]
MTDHSHHLQTQRFCPLCAKIIKFGRGGSANWGAHLKSAEHEKNAREAKNFGSTKQITNFFNTRPRAPPAPQLTPVNVPPSASTSLVIDVDQIPDSPISDPHIPTNATDPGDVLLSRLRTAISTLPSSVPLAHAGDFLSRFSVDPTALLLPGQDPWEDMIHGAFDSFLLDGPNRKNCVQLSEVIRRGELGMDGFLNWLEICFFQLKISPPMVEDRVERIIQAMILLGATTSAPTPPSLVVAPAAPRDVPISTKQLAIGCPGQKLPIKEGNTPFLSYPVALHALRQLSWGVEFGTSLVVRSNDCKRHTETSGVCLPCELLLRHPVIKGILDRNIHGPHINTPHAFLTMGDTQDLLKKKNAQINSLKLTGLNLSRALLVRARHLDAHSRFVHAVSQGNVPRIHSVVNNSLQHGDSIFAINDRLGLAAIGAFKDQSYAHTEYQKLYLLLKLGGQAAAELAHRTMGLPSINATKQHIASVPLLGSPKSPTMEEMIHNLKVSYPTPFAASRDGARGPGIQLMIDDIKVEGRMRWSPRRNEIHGVCREHSNGYDLQFRSAAQAEVLHAGIASGKVHLASEATVVAVNSFSASPDRSIAHPFIISPTCKREGTNDRKALLTAARDAIDKMADHIGGRLYCISSDGDSKVRAATLLLTFIHELNRTGELFKKLGDLSLFDYHCGRNEITGNMDPKHVLKRFRNTLIRLLSTTIDGVVLVRQLIKAHLLQSSGHTGHHIDTLLYPNDRQSVTLMYNLLSSIAILPEALDTDLPAFRNTRRILRLLGALYRHILEAYTNIKLSLQDQLVHISAAMHLMMAIYKKEAGRFVPSQTYFDFMTMGKNIFFCVAKTQIDDPNGSFWIIGAATDPLELSFGKVRTMTGNDCNTDMLQLPSRLTAAVTCENILAEHPDWSQGARRLRLPVWQDSAGDVSAKIDHITERSWEGDTLVKNASTMTGWGSGRVVAEGELIAAGWEPPFEAMERAGGFSIFCPFGKNKLVLIDGQSPDETNEEEDEENIVTSAVPQSNSDADFLPDYEDLALEALSESKDRLKRVRGFGRHNEPTRVMESNDTIPGEAMVLTEDPAALLVHSNGFIWLAVVLISGISRGSTQLDSVPARLLGEPDVRVKVQIMELIPTSRPPRPDSEEGDWEWNEKFVKISGTSTISDVEGRLLQLVNPAVLPTTRTDKGGSTYHFKSTELVAIAASLELSDQSIKRHPEVAFGGAFPYRTSAGKFYVFGFACFVCNKEGSSLVQEEGCCSLCPTVALSMKSPPKIVEHMAIHILFNTNPPIDPDADVCGFCLSTGGTCSIRLLKRKGREGGQRIDLEQSRCPNAANLGLGNAAKFSANRPCTNIPVHCPLLNCADVVWTYNLESHIRRIHPSANLEAYESYYAKHPNETSELKRISRAKTRKSSKKAITFRISERHSTQNDFATNSAVLSNNADLEDTDDEMDTHDAEELEQPQALPISNDIATSPGPDNTSSEPSAVLPVQVLVPVVIPGGTVRPNPRPRFRSAASIPRDKTPDLPATVASTKSNMPATSPTAELVLPSADSSVGFPTLNQDVSSDDEENSGKRKRRTRHPSKRQHQAILSDDEKDCDDPGCTETRDLETVACSVPLVLRSFICAAYSMCLATLNPVFRPRVAHLFWWRLLPQAPRHRARGVWATNVTVDRRRSAWCSGAQLFVYVEVLKNGERYMGKNGWNCGQRRLPPRECAAVTAPERKPPHSSMPNAISVNGIGAPDATQIRRKSTDVGLAAL